MHFPPGGFSAPEGSPGLPERLDMRFSPRFRPTPPASFFYILSRRFREGAPQERIGIEVAVPAEAIAESAGAQASSDSAIGSRAPATGHAQPAPTARR